MKIRNQRVRVLLNRCCDLVGLPWVAFPVIPQDNKVMFYQRDRIEFGFLSNFYPCRIEIDGKIWPHIEAYYQSQKSTNPDFHDQIQEIAKPAWAKYIGDSRIGGSENIKEIMVSQAPG